MNECPPTAILARAFTALLLDDVEDSAIIAHVEVCAGCQSLLEAMLVDGAGTMAEEEQADAGRDWSWASQDKTVEFCEAPSPSSARAANLRAEEMPLPQVPGYEILCRLGKGGMGVVYKARRQELNRIVALKMILAGEHANADQLTRFHAEAEAVASLRHPNIVAIYDVGVANGMPYLVLEYLPGGSLNQLLLQGPLPPKRCAEMLAALARAIHTAHLAGIIHRDLNPGNVLFAEDGTAKIADFGVAKRREAVGQTHMGQLVGTPAYMAPEQARGESASIGPATDVYALGAVLYEALTGRPPFQGRSVIGIVHKVQHDEPVPPRRLARQTPPDLETVCLKALRKEAKERYTTAQEFADELDRFLHDEPVRARPLSWLEKVFRWCRRKPTLAGLLAVTLGLILMAALAGILVFDRMQLRQEHQQTEKALAGEQEARRKEKRNLYVNDITTTDWLYHENQLLRARQLLEGCAVDQRGWEWHYLDRITNDELFSLTGHTQSIHTLALTPQRRLLASGSADGSLVLWDSAAAKRLLELPGGPGSVWSAAFSADGTKLASVVASGRLIVWELQAGADPKPRQTIRAPLKSRLGMQAALGYHPSKSLLAVATGVQRGEPGCLLLLDAAGKEIRRWSSCADRGCVALAWSADGRRLAASFIPVQQTGAKGEVVIFDPDKSEPLRRFQANGGLATALAFSPDGRTLASGGQDRSIELRDACTFVLQKMCGGHKGAITSLAFRSDCRLVSGSTDTTVRVWNRHSGQELFVYRGHYGPVRCLAIQPETGSIYSGSDDITIKAWRAEKSQQGQAYRLHQGAATAVAFSPDGTAVISVGMDGSVWRIDAAGEQQPRRLRKERRPLRQVRFLPQSQTLLVAGGDDEAGGEDGAIRLIDARDGRLVEELDTQLALVSSLSVSRDGKRLSAVGRTRQHHSVVQLWDMTCHPPRCDSIPPALLPGTPLAAQLYSAGQKMVVMLSQVDYLLKPSYVLLDLSGSPRLVPETRYAVNGPRFAVFTADESMMFMGGQSQGFNKFKVNPNGLFSLARFNGHAAAIRSGALSPDEALFATASEDETIRLWDPHTDRELVILRGDAGPMNDVAFSPTGGFLAAAQASGVVWVWDGRPRLRK